MPEKSPQKVPAGDIIRAFRETLDNNADLLLVDVTLAGGVMTFHKEDPDNNITLDLNGVWKAKEPSPDDQDTIDPATEETAGKLPIASEAEAVAGVDDTKAMTPLKTAAAIDAELNDRNLLAATLDNVVERQTESGVEATQPIKTKGRVTGNKLAMLEPGQFADLTGPQKAAIRAVIWSPGGDLLVTTLVELLGLLTMTVTAVYDPAAHTLSLTTANAQGAVTYDIPSLGISNASAASYAVPPELRSGATTLIITAKTATQSATTAVVIPADPLGNFYITAAYVARNVGGDGVSSISHFVKAKGPGIYYTVTGLNGTTVPVAIDGVKRLMTTEGYQRPGLFSGVAPFAGLDVNCGNGFYRVKYEMQDHPDITLTLDYQISDSQPQLVLYESTIKPPEDKLEEPDLSDVIITTGEDFSVVFPPYGKAPVGSTYSLNFRPNGTTFNSSNRTLSGNVPAGNEAAARTVQYVINTPGGGVESVDFQLTVIADTTPSIKKAVGFFNDDDPTIPGLAAHSIVIQTVFQPAGTVPQVGIQLIQETGVADQTNWINAAAFNDGSAFNFKQSGTPSPFASPGDRIKYYLRLNSASPAILLYDRDIQDTAANRAQVIVNYPTLSSGATSTAVLDANLGPEQAWTNQAFIGVSSNPAKLIVRPVINENNKVVFYNDAETDIPGYMHTYLLDGYGKDGSTQGSTHLHECDEAERGVTHHIICHIIANGTPPASWTNQNFQLEEACDTYITIY